MTLSLAGKTAIVTGSASCQRRRDLALTDPLNAGDAGFERATRRLAVACLAPDAAGLVTGRNMTVCGGRGPVDPAGAATC